MQIITKLLLAFILLYSTTTKAQNITGKIYDNTNNKSIANAVIAILQPKDSILIKFTRSNKNGDFVLQNIPSGKYIFMVTHPVYADYLDDITSTNEGLALNNISFVPKSKLLQEVIVKSGSPIRIKGDTVSYTADSFKVSANANVEELLKKLPGIQVDKDGKIKAMGEQVQKVLVDGEEFFGDDPGMAVKNLRADAVKEVQVYDKKSDQAEFTGIDDGQKQKTINLKLKEDKKKGYFGKLDAAAGLLKNIENRYNTNAMLNAFKGKRKLSTFLLRGNTGQDGLSWQDNEKFGGENDNVSMSMDDDGGMMTVWRGGTTDDEIYINTENGFITNTNAGLQYSNKWNDKTTLNFSPKYNSQQYNNTEGQFIQRQIGDSILNESTTKNVNVNRYNFKNNVLYDVKIDSSNSLKLTFKANFYHTESSENITANTISNTLIKKNSNDRLFTQNGDKTALTAIALFRHKFKKARRTLSLNTEWNKLNNEGINYLTANSQSFVNGLPSFTINQNQQINNEKTTTKLTSKIVYTEPLNKKFALELSYELSYSKGINNQIINGYSPFTGKYDDFIDTLSNNFNQLITINKPAAKLSYNFKKFKFNLGSGFGITNFDFTDKTLNKEYKRDFTNIFPSAGISYSYKANHSINFSYNGNTTQPTLNQLQPLRNNNNLFNQYIGNPLLKQSFTNSFNVSHNSYNFIKDMWTYQSFNIRTTSNAITNSININLDSGKTITKPINTNGNIYFNFWSGVGFKIKKLNINFNVQPTFSYNKFADVINDKTSFSKTVNAGLGLWLSKSKDKKYDISIGNDVNLNRNTTSQNNSINQFYTNTVNVNATVYYKKVWSINTDYNFFARQKTVQFQNNLTNHILNARLQKTFKNNEYTAYILVRDIFKQNIGIERSFNSNSSTEVTNLRLQQYWMVGFTWDFKNKTAGPKK